MKKTYFAKLILRAATTALFAFVSAFAAVAQEKAAEFPNFKVTPTGKGVMLMNKKGAPDFAVLIAGGGEPKQDAADGGLRIKTADNGEVVVYLADVKLYMNASGDQPEIIMKNYRARIVPPFAIAPNEKFAVSTELNAVLPVFDLRGGKNEKALVYASSWSVPLAGANRPRRVYLSFIIGDSILTLQKDMPNSDDTDEQNEALMGALKTLTILPPQKVIAAPKRSAVKPSRRGRN